MKRAILRKQTSEWLHWVGIMCVLDCCQLGHVFWLEDGGNGQPTRWKSNKRICISLMLTTGIGKRWSKGKWAILSNGHKTTLIRQICWPNPFRPRSNKGLPIPSFWLAFSRIGRHRLNGHVCAPQIVEKRRQQPKCRMQPAQRGVENVGKGILQKAFRWTQKKASCWMPFLSDYALTERYPVPRYGEEGATLPEADAFAWIGFCRWSVSFSLDIIFHLFNLKR